MNIHNFVQTKYELEKRNIAIVLMTLIVVFLAIFAINTYVNIHNKNLEAQRAKVINELAIKPIETLEAISVIREEILVKAIEEEIVIKEKIIKKDKVVKKKIEEVKEVEKDMDRLNEEVASIVIDSIWDSYCEAAKVTCEGKS